MDPKDYLKDVPPENYFRLADGREIRNLDQLLYILKDSRDTVFYDHVTPDRNDFVSWIKGCIRYQELCNKLIPIKDRQSFLNVLGQEIDLLKNPKISETMKFFSENYDPKKDDAQNISTPVRQPVNLQEPPPAHSPVQSSVNSSVQPSNPQASISQAPVPQAVSSSDVSASAVGVASLSEALDFEQAIPQIVLEIQEEMFFWQ